MRVGLVVTGGFDRSGREHVIPSLLWLVERLARRHDVVVFVLRYHDAPCQYELAGATIHDLGRPRGFRRQLASLRRAIEQQPSLDVLHGYWAHPAGLAAALAGRWFGVPSVVTCDSGEFVTIPAVGYGLQRTARGKLAVWAATTLATAVTVCSEFQARLASEHGVRPVRIPLGVDTSIFTPCTHDSVRHEADNAPYRLLNVASLNRVKDHAVLLDAVRRLVDDEVDVVLDIVGEDTLGGDVQQRASVMGLDDRVMFHGFMASDRLADLYRSADLFVLSSRHEAAGVVLLEAAACGLPIVGSDVGYIADWSPALAEAVGPGDAPALAAGIRRLLTDPARRQRTAAAALAWTRQHDADWTADAFASLYAELVTTRGRTRPPARR
jgi:glycosyltransferase involved in cell wall biosynthesis